MGFGQRSRPHADLGGQPSLVHRPVFPDPSLGKLLLLLDTPPVARAIFIQTRSRAASSQRQCWTLVRAVNASCCASDLSWHNSGSLGYHSPPCAHSISPSILCATAATKHTGFEGLAVKDENRLKLGTFHHQLHHRYFECNYGSLEISWDKFFGRFHNGTMGASERIKERRKRIRGAERCHH